MVEGVHRGFFGSRASTVFISDSSAGRIDSAGLPLGASSDSASVWLPDLATQRILLLLESIVIAERADAYERVIRGVFNRYLEADTSFAAEGGKQYRVPRFLLNDIVRFWRTMAVDFASKQRERGGKGWGLRNVKLRMSRKLIFVSGLFICFGCFLDAPCDMEAQTPETAVHPLLDYLVSFTKQTPLQILAQSLLSYQEPDQTGEKVFGAYDQYLAMLDDEGIRKELDGLPAEEAASNTIFQKVRDLSHQFRDLLHSSPAISCPSVSTVPQ